MRRAQLRNHTPWFLAVVLVTVVMVTLSIAGNEAPYDDRPPLLVSERAPAGQEAASLLSAVSVADPLAPGVHRVVLSADGALPYQVFTLAGPDRIVVDLPGVDASDRGSRIPAGDGSLIQVRVGQYREAPHSMARVVLDTAVPMEWEIHREGSELVILLADRGSNALAALRSAPAAPSVASPPQEVAELIEEAELVEETLQVIREESVEQAKVPALPERPAPQPASLTTTLVPDDADLAPEPEDLPSAMLEAEDEAIFEPQPEALPPESSQEAMTAPASVPLPENPAQKSQWLEPEIAQVVEEAADFARELRVETEKPLALPSEDRSFDSVPLPSTETKTIEDGRRSYTGKRVDLQLVDADIKQVFSLFHDISGLNFVLDPGVGGTVTIVVDNVPWDQALDLILKNNGLDMVLEGNVIRIAPIAKLAQESAARKALHEAKELEAPAVTKTRTLSYAKAMDVETIIREAILSPKGRVIIDERTNTLIIRDIPTRVEAIDRLLQTLDAETPQVMIEARIVEVSRDFVKDLGVSWGVFAGAHPNLGTATGLDFPHRATGGFDLNLPKNPAATSLGFSFGNVLDSFTLDITLDALESEGYARRLSQPRIATQNNARAEIEQGVRIPVVSTTATEIDVRFVAASLRLIVTPQITAEGTVVLDIEVENNSPDFVNTVGEVPAINTQRATTKVLIADGGTTVIGGIFTVNEGENESGVPWFRNIPGFGWLFRSKNIQSRNRELLIFITPRIIKAS